MLAIAYAITVIVPYLPLNDSTVVHDIMDTIRSTSSLLISNLAQG